MAVAWLAGSFPVLASGSLDVSSTVDVSGPVATFPGVPVRRSVGGVSVGVEAGVGPEVAPFAEVASVVLVARFEGVLLATGLVVDPPGQA